jgi:hypothetical protein
MTPFILRTAKIARRFVGLIAPIAKAFHRRMARMFEATAEAKMRQARFEFDRYYRQPQGNAPAKAPPASR